MSIEIRPGVIQYSEEELIHIRARQARSHQKKVRKTPPRRSSSRHGSYSFNPSFLSFEELMHDINSDVKKFKAGRNTARILSKQVRITESKGMII